MTRTSVILFVCLSISSLRAADFADSDRGLCAARDTLAYLNKLSISDRHLVNDWNNFNIVYGQMSDGLAQGIASLAELAFPGQGIAEDHSPPARPVKSKTPEFDAARQVFALAALNWSLQYDKEAGRHAQEYTEIKGAKRTLSIEKTRAEYLTIKIEEPRSGSSIELVQIVNGAARLTIKSSEQTTIVDAPNFSELLYAEPEKMQQFLLRPLSEFGIQIPLHRDLPIVMAAATTGFSPPSPEMRKRVEGLIEQVQDPQRREYAVSQLIRLFPNAVFDIMEARTTAPSLETKAQLEKVIAAHPGIAQARIYVSEKKLHQNRAYLLGILRDAPFLKTEARARLSKLYGKDYGDDAAAWPR